MHVNARDHFNPITDRIAETADCHRDVPEFNFQADGNGGATCTQVRRAA